LQAQVSKGLCRLGVFTSVWRHLSASQQRVLQALVTACPDARSWIKRNSESERLAVLGLIEQGENGIRPSGDAFRAWLADREVGPLENYQPKPSGQSRDKFPTFPRELVGDRVRVFVGHGHNAAWREVAMYIDRLDKGRIESAYYEEETRAGLQVGSILDQLLDTCDAAVLVATAEDRVEGIGLLPRQNVVHEIGLFQGALPPGRVIILQEKEAVLPSNLSGRQVVKFDTGNIRACLGELNGFLRREKLL
jgi:hypothetical protein